METEIIEVENFEINKDDYSYSLLNTNYKKCLYSVVYLQQSMIYKVNNELFTEEYSVLFNKIFETIDYSCKILKMSK
jgi:hypothetical protein